MKNQYIEREYKKILKYNKKLIIVTAILYIVGMLLGKLSLNSMQLRSYFFASTIGFLICEGVAIATYIKDYSKFTKH
jgi:hypothetical protein